MTIEFFTYIKGQKMFIETWQNADFVPRKDDVICDIFHGHSGIVMHTYWQNYTTVHIEVKLPMLN